MSERTNAIGDELLALRDGQGRISPANAVDWARTNTNSYLHGALTWDDGIAGERYRIWQVRSLIAIHITNSEGERRFVSLSIDRIGTHVGGYRPIDEVMSDEALRDVMVRDALRELERVQKRYEKVTELANVWSAVNKARARRGRRPAKTEARVEKGAEAGI